MRGRLAVLFAHAALVAAECVPLQLGQQLAFITSAKSPACFVIVVPEGISAQVAAEQPEDLALEAHGASGDIIADGFQFGLETLTLPAGQYRIVVSLVPPATHAAAAHIMLRNAPPLHAASDWIQAEAQATLAKRTGKEEDAEKSTRLWEALGDPSAIARTHLQLGDALIGTGDSWAARQAYEKALGQCRSISDLRCAAEAANNSGWASERLGEFDPALQWLKEAAEDWRQLGDQIHEGQTLSNIGVLFGYVSDSRNALDYYGRAASLLARRDRLAYARVLNNTGLTYTSLAQYQQALPQFQQAIAVESAHADTAAEAAIPRMNLGRALMLAGDLNSAEKTLNQALAAAMQQPNRQTRALVLNNLGQVLWRQHRLDAAEEKLNEALQLHEAVKDKRGASAARYQLALIARDRGDSARARQLLEQAIDVQTSSGFRRAAADSMAALAAVELATGDYTSAQAMASRGAALLESVRGNVPGPELRASFYDQERQFLDVLVDVAMRPGNPQSAGDGFLETERGLSRSLLDTLAEGLLAQSVPAGLAQERARVQRQVDLLSLRLSSSRAAQQGELRQRVEALLARSMDLDTQIRTSVAETSLGRPIDAVEPWQRRCIPAGSAVLEYHLGERRSHLWFVTPDSMQAFDLPPKQEIDREAARAVALLGDIAERRRLPGKQAEFERAVRRLSATLLGPLKDVALPRRLIVVLDGSLNRVPFAALRLPGTNTYLGLTHDLIRSPSASFLEAGREPRAPAEFRLSVLAIADPVFSLEDARVPAGARKRFAGARTPDLARIPFMADIRAISRLVPESRRRILQGFDANPARIRELPLDQFGILHFSTHAIIDDRIPELSGIALSMVDRSGRPIDGFLHPHQLADWRLGGSVVVLSACDTGLGKLLMGEGLVGLSSSLFHAGAAQLVLSLAEVDADASAEFFSDVYRHVLARRPVPMERALTLARQEMARSDRWSDPYYWSTFVAIGRPSQDR